MKSRLLIKQFDKEELYPIGYNRNDKIVRKVMIKSGFMMQIRPISKLGNKFTEIEKAVNGREPTYLTKNGYGSIVVLGLDVCFRLLENVEYALDEMFKLSF